MNKTTCWGHVALEGGIFVMKRVDDGAGFRIKDFILETREANNKTLFVFFSRHKLSRRFKKSKITLKPVEIMSATDCINAIIHAHDIDQLVFQKPIND